MSLRTPQGGEGQGIPKSIAIVDWMMRRMRMKIRMGGLRKTRCQMSPELLAIIIPT